MLSSFPYETQKIPDNFLYLVEVLGQLIELLGLFNGDDHLDPPASSLFGVFGFVSGGADPFDSDESIPLHVLGDLDSDRDGIAERVQLHHWELPQENLGDENHVLDSSLRADLDLVIGGLQQLPVHCEWLLREKQRINYILGCFGKPKLKRR